MLSKDLLISTGISPEDADKIMAQYNNESESAKVEKQVTPEPTPADITSVSQLTEYAKGQVVRLPDFAPGQPFVARLKRPSMLVLVKSGKIPNQLLGTASELFNGKDKEGNENNDEETMGSMYDVLKIIAESSLVSPTIDEINKAGIELTDEQLIAIFNYSQQGVEGLKSFR